MKTMQGVTASALPDSCSHKGHSVLLLAAGRQGGVTALKEVEPNLSINQFDFIVPATI